MSRIVFYSGRKKKMGGIKENLLRYADTQLFFLVFICSMIAGGRLYAFSLHETVLYRFSEIMIESPVEKICLWMLFASIMIILICCTGALSCTGVITALVIPFGEGLLYGMLGVHTMLNTGAKGLGCFALTVLPGAVVMISVSLYLCSYSARVSKITAMSVLFGEKENVELKRFLLRFAFCFAFMAAGILLQYVCVKLFGGLFK